MADFIGFATSSRSDVEEQCARIYAEKHGLQYKKFGRANEVPAGWTPVGTIEWFTQVTGWKVDADSYPSFLRHCLKRKVWTAESWPLGEKVFIKPADKLKRFNGFVTDGSYKKKKRGPYRCSEAVEFVDEWRYYVSNGTILDAAWYAGRNEGSLAPSLDEFNIEWPEGLVCGVDFGMTKDRGLCLVEFHEPLAVGNYLGLNSKEYAEWLIDGWKYLSEKYGKETEEPRLTLSLDASKYDPCPVYSIGEITFESTVPSAYRLVKKKTGDLVLQGQFAWVRGLQQEFSWKDIPTEEE